ncbi:hypothetical protein ATL17_3394 [Maritalea mobilis]|uniref:Uncharacterized protein n=1 Tax=Maritalea mobilis TaxID=483324 RepID=A0A4R6VMD5_9HYPH|nr:hypothetical protein [Maritalea mobilis]TDQ60505.1 hypothetical protein ATL17_3394 [Maritalea mobilis]
MMKKNLLAIFAFCIVLFSAGSAFAYSGELFRVCGLNPAGDNYLSLRECGNSNCKEVTRLGPGTYLWTMEPFDEQGWRQVVPMYGVADMFSGDPDVGFVFARYICRVE